jgi:hypothetical protein
MVEAYKSNLMEVQKSPSPSSPPTKEGGSPIK